MFSRMTVGKRLIAAFGAAVLTLTTIGIITYRSTLVLVETDSVVAHLHEVRAEFANLLSSIKDAETGQRGYLVTGVDDYLKPYSFGSAAVYKTLANLKDLTLDSPQQQRRVGELRSLIDAEIGTLKEAIDLRRVEGFEVAQKFVLAGEGKAVMDQIRAVVKDADNEELRVQTQRFLDDRAAADVAVASILWGGLAGVLIVGAIGLFISRSLSAQIGAAVGNVKGSSAELQTAANQQATGAKEQTAAMTEISVTIGELLATSRQIAESAQRVARNAEQTASAANTGHATVDRTQESMSSIRRQVDQIVSHMLELGRKSQEIDAVLDIVSELAEQTNILAINATIEAAGAGEAGTRFAVVAEEIRKLADRVGVSTKEVRTLIEDVRSAVNTTVAATESGSKTVDSGTRQFNEVATSFKEIATLVTTTTDAVREIELSTKQQSSAVEQVNVAIANITQTSVETEVSAGQTLQTASQMVTLAKDLLRIVQPREAA